MSASFSGENNELSKKPVWSRKKAKQFLRYVS
jgi:hypothetical protein